MNIRVAGGGGSGDGAGSPSDAGYSAALVDVGRKMLAMDGLQLRPIRTTGPSPVAHNGRYWTPDRRREDAETVRYIRCLVQTCEAIKPWIANDNQKSSGPPTRTKVTLDQLPKIMQKVSKIGMHFLIGWWVSGRWQFVSDLVYVTFKLRMLRSAIRQTIPQYDVDNIMVNKNVGTDAFMSYL